MLRGGSSSCQPAHRLAQLSKEPYKANVRIDRRSFVSGVAGTLAWLAAGAHPARARREAFETALRIHRETRNTPTGALGELLRGLSSQPRRYKPYEGIPRLALPADPDRQQRSLDEVVGDWTPAAAISATPLPVERLGRLLRLTNGVTGRWENVSLRAAPSAGALYAGEVYVVAVAVPGLPAGAYNFHVRRHTLVPVRRGRLAKQVADALEQPTAVAEAPAFVLLTNVFRRYTGRYRNRGYRYGLIDSGHIGENLRLAAAADGLVTVSSLRFRDDALNELLEIDGREEAVCVCHAVGHPGVSAGAVRERRFAEKQLAEKGLELSGSAPERYHEATKLVPTSQRPTPPSMLTAVDAPTHGLVVPAPRKPSGTSVRRAIETRRSAEVFREEPMGLAELGFLLGIAAGNRALELAPVEVMVVAHRVSNLEPGVHRWVRASRGLAPLRKGDFGDALRRACLRQDKASEAAAGVAMVAPIARAVRGRGERSYRELLIEAGAIAQRLYLAAEAIGLAARNLAAFLDDDLNTLLELDGSERAVVHLTMVGPGS